MLTLELVVHLVASLRLHLHFFLVPFCFQLNRRKIYKNVKRKKRTFSLAGVKGGRPRSATRMLKAAAKRSGPGATSSRDERANEHDGGYIRTERIGGGYYRGARETQGRGYDAQSNGYMKRSLEVLAEANR